MVGRDVHLFMQLAAMAECGAWPVSGGTLDQCVAFFTAYQFYANESQFWKSKNNPLQGLF